MIVVAYESVTDTIVRTSVEGALADPRDHRGIVSSVAILQPERSHFVREHRVQAEGAKVMMGDSVAADRELVVISLLCRGSKSEDGGGWTIRRELVGSTQSSEAPPVEVNFGTDFCRLNNDIVPPGSLADGRLKYVISLWKDDRQVASATKEFAVTSTSAF